MAFVRVRMMGAGVGIPDGRARGVAISSGFIVGYGVGVGVRVAVGSGGVTVGVVVGVCVGVEVGVGNRDGLGVRLGVGVGSTWRGIGVGAGGSTVATVWAEPGAARNERAVTATSARTMTNASPFHHRFGNAFIVCLWSPQRKESRPPRKQHR
jgi:hypothetical protein